MGADGHPNPTGTARLAEKRAVRISQKLLVMILFLTNVAGRVRVFWVV
jgi:hypothetical protein